MLAEHLPDFVLMTDCDGRILFINRVYAQFQMDKGSSARSAFDFIDPAGADEYRQAFAQTIATQTMSRLEARAMGPEGKVHLVRQRSSSPSSRAGEVEDTSSSSRTT